jgi:uncharacterized protein (DUF433 family)
MEEAELTPIPAAPTLDRVDYRARIKVIAGKRGGQPTIRGLRITVADVLGYLAAGMMEDQILADFPDLQRDDIRAALAYPADRERHHSILAG